MGGSSSPATIEANPAYMAGMMGQMNLSQGLVNAALMAKPEIRHANIDEMQSIASREALINALKSAEMERTLTPDVAETRAELSRQVAGDLKGRPDKELSNFWLRSGLADLTTTGANTDSGFARSALADRTRSDYFTNRLMNQNKAASFLSANPQPIAGVDPGNLATQSQQARADNMRAREGYANQLLAALSNHTNNASNAMQQQQQYQATIDAANASAGNQMMAANASNRSNLWGALLGAAGTLGGAYLGGPVGAAAGGSAGFQLGRSLN